MPPSMATRTDIPPRRHRLYVTAGAAASALVLFALLFPREEQIAERPALPLTEALSPHSTAPATDTAEAASTAFSEAKSHAESNKLAAHADANSLSSSQPTETKAAAPQPTQASTAAASEISPASAIAAADDSEPVELLPLPAVDLSNWDEHTVKNGDNLSLIFARAGLNASDVYEFMNKAANSKLLLRIRPGQTIGFQVKNKQLQALRYTKDRLSSIEYHRNNGGFNSETIERQPNIRYQTASGTIDDSLYLSATEAGLPEGLVMSMANIFGTVMDFVYDVRKGDSFTVIYEELHLDGEKLRNGKIIAAEYQNRGQLHQAFSYTDKSGKQAYYSADGVSMQKAFLRAPLDFTRISSGFNPSRLHPIFKTKRPHRGIDYAASRGTPVYAAGDGRVIISGYNKGAGNYVVIKHGEKYQTKYLHLHKRGVKKGQKVRQRQIIGWVGSTGYATGAHLHYEFLVNGVHRNPRTIVKKLPKARKLASSEMDAFRNHISSIQIQLNSYASQNAAEASNNASEG